jgi:hypothetical protein
MLSKTDNASHWIFIYSHDAFATFFGLVVVGLRVSLEGDFLRAFGAFDVEAVDGDVIVHFVGRLSTGIDFVTFDDECSTVSTL